MEKLGKQATFLTLASRLPQKSSTLKRATRFAGSKSESSPTYLQKSVEVGNWLCLHNSLGIHHAVWRRMSKTQGNWINAISFLLTAHSLIALGRRRALQTTENFTNFQQEEQFCTVSNSLNFAPSAIKPNAI